MTLLANLSHASLWSSGDEMQVSTRAATDDVATCQDAVKQLREKMTSLEDRERRLNIRLVGLERTTEF
jgi:predicted DNA-binding protein YlxM (UPF0122 family)